MYRFGYNLGRFNRKFFEKFYQLSPNHEEIKAGNEENSDKENVVAEIFKIEGDLFDHETPLCKAFNEFIYLLKTNTDLFTLDIQGIKTYEEYEYELNNNMTCGLEEQWSDNGVPYQLCDHICETFRFNNRKAKWPTYHKWYDNLFDGVLKEEALMHKAIHKGSLGNATQGLRIFCSWLKGCFENFHELDYELLVKLEEFWWSENTLEYSPFIGWGDTIRIPFANTNLNATYNPHLDISYVFDKNDGAKDNDDVHDKVDAMEQHEESRHKLNDDPSHRPPICKIRSFVMTKYSSRPEEEYVAIKEHGHDNLARADVDACQD
ncbi:hypothetical protein Tco_1025623 [Tanacetum coccineum]